MSFKTRIILYALLPLTFITGAMVFITSYQVNVLSSKESQTFRDTLLATKKRVVTNYINLAQAAIQPILDDRKIDKESAKKEVKRILNNLKYGDNDGYFFVYDQQGVNIVHPVLKHVVGENLYNLNSNGDFVIQDLLKLANNGGGFLSYRWHKPSTKKEQEKTSYVVKLNRWGWVLGTGFYMDDILKEVTSVENQVKRNIRKTFYIVLALTLFSTVLLGFLVNWHERRLADVRLRELASKYVLLQVKERRCFARELHDNISQLMVAVKYHIELAIHQTSNSKPHDLNHLEEAKNILNETINEVRHISHSLRPSLLDDMGLKVALENLLNQYEERIGISVVFDYQVDVIQLSEDIEITLYRITQEALKNIEKHAEAQTVFLKLSTVHHSITLEIRDDGKGFSLPQTHKNTGIGLQNMRERTELLGGTFNIKTSSTSGTQIRVELPQELKR